MTAETTINQKFLRGGLNQWVSESVGQLVSWSVRQKIRRVEGEKTEDRRRPGVGTRFIASSELKASKPGVQTTFFKSLNIRYFDAFTAISVHLKKPSGGPKGLIGPPRRGAPGRRRLRWDF
jgi:hypothetical protein